MANSGKQSPLGVNAYSSLLQDEGLRINPRVTNIVGTSKINSNYTPGSIINNTSLKWLTYAINKAYARAVATDISSTTYDDMITIGDGECEALGNSKPPTYNTDDPSSRWDTYGAPATTGYSNYVNTNYPSSTVYQEQGQLASYLPYLYSNPNNSVTQWGFLRLFPYMAWNQFNWNGIPNNSDPFYKDFCASFLTADSFVNSNNKAILSCKNSETFLDGTYSNMNDLISADISGVSLATQTFGSDCIALGKTIDLTMIETFGYPSTLLVTLKKVNALTTSLTTALLGAGLLPQEIDNISRGTKATKEQEQKIYAAYLLIAGVDLDTILVSLNCKTQGFETLADLLNVKKLFPNSYKTLTVPIWNAALNLPTNSKTYYPIFAEETINDKLEEPAIAEALPQVYPPGPPIPVLEPLPVISTPVTKTKIYASGVKIKEYFGGNYERIASISTYYKGALEQGIYVRYNQEDIGSFTETVLFTDCETRSVTQTYEEWTKNGVNSVEVVDVSQCSGPNIQFIPPAISITSEPEYYTPPM